MSCNRGVNQSQAAASALGCPALEGAWASQRGERPTLSMATLPDAARRYLSCGHPIETTAALGEQEWCAQCDDWAEVTADARPPGASILGTPRNSWSPGQVQLWASLEAEADRLGLDPQESPYMIYAPSDGKGDGKVYGGVYGQGKDGNWHSLTSWGPIGGAKCHVDTFGSRHGAHSHNKNKYYEKMKKYSHTWPGEGSGRGIERCPRCKRGRSKGAACDVCSPTQAKADAGRAVYGRW